MSLTAQSVIKCASSLGRGEGAEQRYSVLSPLVILGMLLVNGWKTMLKTNVVFLK